MTVIEKRFKILSVDKKNSNHRAYTSELVNSWIKNTLNNSESPNEGYSLEYAIDEDDNERDIYKEFVSSSLDCGIVRNLEIVDGVLYADVKLKLPEFCNSLTEKIYSEEISIDDIAIVPKGKGSVKNQTIQNDYELFGFNLILLEDSAFSEQTELEEKEEKLVINTYKSTFLKIYQKDDSLMGESIKVYKVKDVSVKELDVDFNKLYQIIGQEISFSKINISKRKLTKKENHAIFSHQDLKEFEFITEQEYLDFLKKYKELDNSIKKIFK